METESLLVTILSIIDVTFQPVTPGIFLAILSVLLLLLGSALVSGSEVAFFSLDPADKNSLEEKNSRSARQVMKLLTVPDRLLATILIANNFINVGIVIISAFAMNGIFQINNPHWLEFIVQVVIVTFLLLLFGEILPKLYANQYSVKFSLFMAFPLNLLEKLFHPIASFLIFSTSVVNKRLANKRQNISIDELSNALELTSDDITEDKNILEGIIKFGNIDVREIMKSRIDVVAVDIKTKFDHLISVIVESGYSRIPIFSENFDNIKGILYIKDLLPHLHKSNNFKWQSLIRPPYYIPENKKIDDLLREFQIKKIHMAVVIDEYGGISGIITLEDIIEEIVGDIIDESDEDEVFYEKIDDNIFIFNGKILLNDFYKILEIPDNIFNEIKGDAETLAGLILEIKGEIPEKNEEINYKNFNFLIESVDRRRIRQIKVVINYPFENTDNPLSEL